MIQNNANNFNLSLFDHILEGIFIIDKKFIVIFWNKCIEEWSGISKNTICNKNIKDFYPKLNKPFYSKAILSVTEGGPPVIFSSELHHHLIDCPLETGNFRIQKTTVTHIPAKKENEFYALFSITDETPLRNTISEYTRLSKIMLDEIENRKKIETELIKSKQKAEENDQLKSAFLSNMSHEIRTPLGGIIGFSEMLLRPKITEEKRKQFVNIIINSCYQLLSIINDILDISKIETGQMEIELDYFDLNLFLLELYSFYKTKVNDKNINLYIDKELSDGYCTIKTDRAKLKQILMNLISNAVKFTNQGHIKFGYTIDNQELVFFVEDSGIGIEIENQAKVFERFVQVDFSQTRKFGGAGLGLSICKGYIEMLNGKIWVDSIKNVGSTFYFSIPFIPLTTESNVSRKTEQQPPILIAEDEMVNYLFIEEIINSMDLKAKHAVNGIEAVEICRKFKDIKLIIMDIQMPFMNGIEALQQIRKFRENITIIAVTAFAFISEKKTILEAGFDGYMSKPVDIIELESIIKSIYHLS
jgi:signal transduction histidine kinase/CheY-like chemotaxis protein